MARRTPGTYSARLFAMLVASETFNNGRLDTTFKGLLQDYLAG